MASILISELSGTELGNHTATYDENASILYNLCLGARADDLSLVYERDLQVLPTYACALGLWAVEAAGRTGAYEPTSSLHASQKLIVHKALPAAGSVAMSARVSNVFDKGRASLVEIEVTSEYFTAIYGIFLPGIGNWGGERGPSSRAEEVDLSNSSEYRTADDLAALYRLTGDRHPVHIDPEIAKGNGFDRPILHGLCTLGIAAREIANQASQNPTDLESLDVRLAGPVVPGQTIVIDSNQSGKDVLFRATVEGAPALANGIARFTPTASTWS